MNPCFISRFHSNSSAKVPYIWWLCTTAVIAVQGPLFWCSGSTPAIAVQDGWLGSAAAIGSQVWCLGYMAITMQEPFFGDYASHLQKHHA